MVVDRVLLTVMHRVVQPHVSERDVPDHQIKRGAARAVVGERAGDDPRVRVKLLRDRRGRVVQLHPDHLGARGREADEHSRAAPRLEHPPTLEPELGGERPHRPRDRRVRVVRVDRRATRRCVPLLAEQLVQLLTLPGPLRPGLVEDLRDRPPARPRRERLALHSGRGALLTLKPRQHP